MQALGARRPKVPRTFDERRAFWDARLRAGERRLLAEVIGAGDAGISLGELADAVQMTATGGTFATYVGTLHTNRLVSRKGDRLYVHPWLSRGPSEAS